jgi:hypothetical protein
VLDGESPDSAVLDGESADSAQLGVYLLLA